MLNYRCMEKLIMSGNKVLLKFYYVNMYKILVFKFCLNQSKPLGFWKNNNNDKINLFINITKIYNKSNSSLAFIH